MLYVVCVMLNVDVCVESCDTAVVVMFFIEIGTDNKQEVKK
jgi:hypothetical protein